MPMVGLGTFLIPKENLSQTIAQAYELGYRKFDTAWRYHNEREISEALKENEAVIQLFDLVLNTQECSLCKKGENVLLTRTEYRILELLMKSPGRVYTKQQIFDYAWEEMYMGEDSTLMVHISNLRNKVEDDPKNPVMIKTVKGLGYRFEKES